MRRSTASSKFNFFLLHDDTKRTWDDCRLELRSFRNCWTSCNSILLPKSRERRRSKTPCQITGGGFLNEISSISFSRSLQKILFLSRESFLVGLPPHDSGGLRRGATATDRDKRVSQKRPYASAVVFSSSLVFTQKGLSSQR